MRFPIDCLYAIKLNDFNLMKNKYPEIKKKSGTVTCAKIPDSNFVKVLKKYQSSPIKRG